MTKLKNYEAFNGRRYGNPWVAEVIKGKIDFSNRVGGYTGRYSAGEEGELYVTDPVEEKVYAYGQKDFRGGNTTVNYTVYKGGKFIPIEKKDLSQYF